MAGSSCDLPKSKPHFLHKLLARVLNTLHSHRRTFFVKYMAHQKVFTLSEVSRHKSMKDCWLVIDGRVLNVTNFLVEHPGGEEVLMELAGKDATKEFKDIGHSKVAQNLLLKHQVGALPGYTFDDPDTKDTSFKEAKSKEMSAFVIKDSSLPKNTAILEFFVPLLVAGSYFTYRYLTSMVN